MIKSVEGWEVSNILGCIKFCDSCNMRIRVGSLSYRKIRIGTIDFACSIQCALELNRHRARLLTPKEALFLAMSLISDGDEEDDGIDMARIRATYEAMP